VEEPKPRPTPSPPPAAADARAQVLDALRRYEAAWEALDVNALMRVQAVGPDAGARIKASMADTRDYQVTLAVQDLRIDPDGRHATVRAAITRDFTPRVGRPQHQSGVNTLTLEKNGESWVITAIK
jgi:ketosteroid isomerase-like protein